ncbi:hypothetical protein D3C72_2034250 [compost metagenome]
MVAVHFQRFADQQFHLEVLFVFLFRQVNHLTAHTFFRFRVWRDLFQRLFADIGVFGRGGSNGAGGNGHQQAGKYDGCLVHVLSLQ